MSVHELFFSGAPLRANKLQNYIFVFPQGQPVPALEPSQLIPYWQLLL